MDALTQHPGNRSAAMSPRPPRELGVWCGYAAIPLALLASAIRFRGIRYLAAANPGMPAGGLFPTSKSVFHGALAAGGLRVPPTVRVTAGGGSLPSGFRPEAIGDGVPAIIAKPDVGARGRGIRLFQSFDEAQVFAATVAEDTVFQHYVAGPEFGVFFHRDPASEATRIVSLVERLPSNFDGSRSRGTAFIEHPVGDSAALLSLLDAASRLHGGLYHGRFDVKAPSLDSLRTGRDVTFLEFNGAASAPTEVFDSRQSAISIVRLTFATIRRGFETGARLGKRGHLLPPYRDLAGAASRAMVKRK